MLYYVSRSYIPQNAIPRDSRCTRVSCVRGGGVNEMDVHRLQARSAACHPFTAEQVELAAHRLERVTVITPAAGDRAEPAVVRAATTAPQGCEPPLLPDAGSTAPA